jgi:voltage-gated potassium channel
MPQAAIGPRSAIVKRVLIAVAALTVTALTVYFDRDGYVDATAGGPITLLDCFYYATVSL